MYADKTLSCRDCGASFIFTTGEQEFFASRGFTNEPTRCPDCRAERKRTQGGGGGYSSGGYSGGGGGGYGRSERTMYPAVCAQCGKDTEVPFEPRSDRPVYCSDCFEAHRPRTDSRGGGRNRW
jgi:CxxC-x17-CxxC domain-containing protein